jgi:hypothetical protein
MSSRLRRVETRLTKLAIAQDIDVTDGKERVVMALSGEVAVTGLDVSLGDLVDFLKKSGIRSSVVVVHNGESLATVQLNGAK